MDQEKKIKEKLKDLQQFTPLLEEMIKCSEAADKSIKTREKLHKMYGIIVGKIPCTKLSNLIRIEEAIVRWNEKRLEKQEPVVLNRLHNLKKRVAYLESLSKNQTTENIQREEKPTEVIILESSDEDEIEIVSYTSPTHKNDNSKASKNEPSTSGTGSNEASSSNSIKLEVKNEDKNVCSELEEGEIEDSDSIISIIDGTAIELEDIISAENENTLQETEKAEYCPKIEENSSKEKEKCKEDFTKVEDISPKETSSDSIENFHDKPPLKTYSKPKISKPHEESHNNDLRTILNAIRSKNKNNNSEKNIDPTTNKLPAADASSEHFAIEENKKETLIVQIQNNKAKTKKHRHKSMDGKIISKKSTELVLGNNLKNKSDLSSNVYKMQDKTTATQSISDTLETSHNKLPLSSNKDPKIIAKDKSSKVSHAEKSEKVKSTNKKRVVQIVEFDNQPNESEQNKNISKSDANMFESISSDEEKFKSSHEMKQKHEEDKKSNTKIMSSSKSPTDITEKKDDSTPVKNEDQNQKTEEKRSDKYLDILYSIDIVHHADSELEKDQDLDIFDEAIFAGSRKHSEFEMSNVNNSEVVNKSKNIERNKSPSIENSNYNKVLESHREEHTKISSNCIDSSLELVVSRRNSSEKSSKTNIDSEISLSKTSSSINQKDAVNSEINLSPYDAEVVWLHDSDTEDFIKKLDMAIHSKTESRNNVQSMVKPKPKISNQSLKYQNAKEKKDKIKELVVQEKTAKNLNEKNIEINQLKTGISGNRAIGLKPNVRDQESGSSGNTEIHKVDKQQIPTVEMSVKKTLNEKLEDIIKADMTEDGPSNKVTITNSTLCSQNEKQMHPIESSSSLTEISSNIPKDDLNKSKDEQQTPSTEMKVTKVLNEKPETEIEDNSIKPAPSIEATVTNSINCSQNEKKEMTSIKSSSRLTEILMSILEDNLDTSKDKSSKEDNIGEEKEQKPASPAKEKITDISNKESNSPLESTCTLEQPPEKLPYPIELDRILGTINETLKKYTLDPSLSIEELTIENKTPSQIIESEFMTETTNKPVSPRIEEIIPTEKLIETHVSLPESDKPDKPLFERRSQIKQPKQPKQQIIDGIQNSIQNSKNNENDTAIHQEKTVIPHDEPEISKEQKQLDEWANKDLNELQEIRMELEKKLGVDLATILQSEHEEDPRMSPCSSNADTLVMNVAQELEDAMAGEVFDEGPQLFMPPFQSYDAPMDTFEPVNPLISYNLPQYLGLPPEIKPNDPRLRSRLTLLYDKTTDPLLKESSFPSKKKPQIPTAQDILGSQAEKVQEEIQTACMKEIGELDFGTAPSKNLHQNNFPSTSTSSNRPLARTYGEYKRLKQAALEAEAAKKKAAIEAANRVHQMELEAEGEKSLEADNERLRSSPFENINASYESEEIILGCRKKKTRIISSSSETDSDSRKSSSRNKLKRKTSRSKSRKLSSENVHENVFTIDSDSVDSTADQTNSSHGNALQDYLRSNNLTIDVNNKEKLKEIAITVMKSLLKDQKFAEFEKLLNSNLQSDDNNIKKSDSTNSKSSYNISNRELTALNKDLHEMFIKDEVLMLGRRKSSIKSLERIGKHFKPPVSLKIPVRENLNKFNKSKYSDEDADTDDFEEYVEQKKYQEEMIQIEKCQPIVKIKKLTSKEISKYTKSLSKDNLQQSEKEDHNLLKPMKIVPFGSNAARRQSRSVRMKSKSLDIKNINALCHYKNPLFTSKCLICYKSFGNLVDHYVISHSSTEVFISRLPPDDFHKLLNNPGKAKAIAQQKNGLFKYSGNCFFCGFEIKGRFDKFSQHYALHTGEFPYECSSCTFMSCYKNVTTRHVQACKKDSKVLTYYAYDDTVTKINLYICSKCNYMQLHKANVVLHIRREHECNFVLETDTIELLLIEAGDQNIEIVNEPVPTTSNADEVEIIFEIQTGVPIDLPVVKQDTDSETDSVVSDISIDLKPEMLPVEHFPNLKVTESTKVGQDLSEFNQQDEETLPNPQVSVSTKVESDLSKFNKQNEKVLTVIHIPTVCADKPDLNKLLQELSSNASKSVKTAETLVVAKPKENNEKEKILQQSSQLLEGEGENNITKVKQENISAEEAKELNTSITVTCTEQKQSEEITIKEEKNTIFENVANEDGLDNLITVIEVVDDDATQIDLPTANSSPDSKTTEKLSPLRIENFGYQEIRENEYIFHCLFKNCNFGVTVSFQDLKDHVNAEHNVKWSGKCSICKNNVSASPQPISEELDHMIKIHTKELQECEDNDENCVLTILKPWLSKTISQKRKRICEVMILEKSLNCLYKCMGNDCSFVTDEKIQASRHLAKHELEVLGDKEHKREWLECSYCEYSARKTLQILEHVYKVHNQSIFQCSRCFYRSCSSVNIGIHQETFHTSNIDKNKTLKCSGNFKSITSEEIDRISKLAATNIMALSCPVCSISYQRRDLMIKHLQEVHKDVGIPKGFSMGLISCIFCKFETDGLEHIRIHMANIHPDEMLYIGVREITDKTCLKDKANIAYIGVEEKPIAKDKEEPVLQIKSEPSSPSSNQILEKLDQTESELLKQKNLEAVQLFNSSLMSMRDLELLCNPSIIIDSDEDECFENEIAGTNDDSSLALYAKLLDTLKYFITSQAGLNPCCICLEKINLEDDWSNHFTKTHTSVQPNALQVCPLCPTMCSFWTYPSHFLNLHTKPEKSYFCYFCGKNFNVLAAAKLHLMSHSVYEQAKLIRVKMKNDTKMNTNVNEIDYQIILPRRYKRKIADVIKHMIRVLEDRKSSEGQIISPAPDLDNFTINLNDNIRGVNYPAFVAAQMRFICTFCSKQLMDEKSLENHFKSVHTSLKVFKCPHCEVTLFNLNDFDRIRDHIRLHSGIFFMCCFCKMYTSNRNSLMEHIKRYRRDSVPIICYARTVFTVKHHFELIHMSPQSKVMDKETKCLFCTKVFKIDKDLEDHLLDVHAISRIYQCDICSCRGEKPIVDLHISNSHVKYNSDNIEFRSKTIFQKVHNAASTCTKRKSPDLNLPDSSIELEKRRKLESPILVINDKNEEIPNPSPSANNSLMNVPPLKDLSVNEQTVTPLKSSPNKAALKCDFCPLKCVSKIDLLKHFKIRHGITLHNSDSGAATSEISNKTENRNLAQEAALKSTTAEELTTSSEVPDSTTSEPCPKRIRLVPIEKLLNQNKQCEQNTIMHISKDISQNSVNQANIQQPTTSLVLQGPAHYVIKEQMPPSFNIAPKPIQNLEKQKNIPKPYVCIYKCSLCSCDFDSAQLLNLHCQTVLPCLQNLHFLMCFHCNTQCTSYKQLLEHWNISAICQAKANYSFRFRLTAKTEKPIHKFISANIIERISKLPMNKSKCFKCPDCNRVYFDQIACLNHIKIKMKSPYFCTYAQEHILYGCDECRTFYMTEAEAIEHISIHTFRFSCVLCKSDYKTQDELFAHYVCFHRSTERSHTYEATSPKNLSIFMEILLIVFPYGIVLSSAEMKMTPWGSEIKLAELIAKTINKGSTTVPAAISK